MKQRVAYLIDGFNFYHSICTFYTDTGFCAKWFDYNALCHTLSEIYTERTKTQTEITRVVYYTALKDYIRRYHPDSVERHENYIKCLEYTGVEVVRGKYKAKNNVYCTNCRTYMTKHEEKETDVNIALTAIDMFFHDECDSIVIISGDTDLLPVIRLWRKRCKGKSLVFAFPYGRWSQDIKNHLRTSFQISNSKYRNHLLPDPVILADGTQIFKPPSW